MLKYFEKKAAEKKRVLADQQLAKVKQIEKEAEYEKRRREIARARLIEQSDTATTDEYTDWVEKFLKKGGGISVTPRNMGNEVLTVRRDGYMPTLYAADALKVIVPGGVNISRTPSGLGRQSVVRR